MVRHMDTNDCHEESCVLADLWKHETQRSRPCREGHTGSRMNPETERAGQSMARAFTVFFFLSGGWGGMNEAGKVH